MTNRVLIRSRSPLHLFHNIKRISKVVYQLLSDFFLYLCLARSRRALQSQLRQILLGRTIHFVDVGAAGDIPPRWKTVQQFVSYVGFEPDDRSRAVIQNAPNRARSYTIRSEALGEEGGGEKPFYLCRKPQVSSSYLPNREFLDLFPNPQRFDVVDVAPMRLSRMDDLGLSNVDFIKVDTQGGELSILKGAPKTLKDCVGLEIEVQFSPLYEDVPLFGEVSAFLNAQGFEFIDFVDLCRWQRVKHRGPGQCVFGDALFFRTPESFISSGNLPSDKLASYLGCLHLYQRFDLIRACAKQMSFYQYDDFPEFGAFFSTIEKKIGNHF